MNAVSKVLLTFSREREKEDFIVNFVIPVCVHDVREWIINPKNEDDYDVIRRVDKSKHAIWWQQLRKFRTHSFCQMWSYGVRLSTFWF